MLMARKYLSVSVAVTRFSLTLKGFMELCLYREGYIVKSDKIDESNRVLVEELSAFA